MRAVDNAIYDRLGDRWYDAEDDPVALLRAEARQRNPWLAGDLEAARGRELRVLDVGCGAGFLTGFLAGRGHRVTGIDLAADALAVAGARDLAGDVTYLRGDATRLPFAAASFDAVCAMDVLEHVERPADVVAEAARVLAPGGRFYFHTFNRTWLAWLVVIKGVEWFVRNTPPDMHVLRLFVTPAELAAMGAAHGLAIESIHGSRPRLNRAFARMLVTGAVGDDFEFTTTRTLRLGYTGVAVKGVRASVQRG